MVSLFTISPSRAQTWARVHGTAAEANVGYAVDQTADGGFIVAGDAGDSAGFPNYSDIYVVKLHPSGNPQWQRLFRSGTYDLARAVEQTTDGGFLVAGETGSAPGHLAGIGRELILLKLDPNGIVEWQKSFDGAGGEFGKLVIETDEGGYLAAGDTTAFGSSCTDVWLVKLDEMGAIEWQKAYGTADCDRVFSMHQTSDGGYVLAGHFSDSLGASGDGLVLKLDATGAIEWQTRFGVAGTSNWDDARSIRDTADGGYIVVGVTQSFGGVGQDGLLVKLDDSGALEWSIRYDGLRGQDGLEDIWTTSDGGFIATGWRPTPTTARTQLWLMRLDDLGNVVWSRAYGGESGQAGYAVQQTADGGFVVTGSTDSFGTTGAWVLRTDSSGGIAASCTIGRDAPVLVVAVAMPTGNPGLAARPTTGESRAGQLVETASGASVTTRCIGAPAEVSQPGSAQPLLFTDAVTLQWEDGFANNASTFNLYRGELTELPSGDFGSCLRSGIAGTTEQGFDDPTAGEDWSYLVTGVNPAGEGTMGSGSGGAPRQNASPCP
jgi:hypothetical protein